MGKHFAGSTALGSIFLIVTACARGSAEKIDSSRSVDQTQVTAAASANSPARIQLDSVSKSPPGTVDSSPPLICTPTTFAPGDTLTLRMVTPHGHYLWIT